MTADASAPKAPLLNHSGPFMVDLIRPVPPADEPDTTMPSRGPCTTFQAKCTPMFTGDAFTHTDAAPAL